MEIEIINSRIASSRDMPTLFCDRPFWMSKSLWVGHISAFSIFSAIQLLFQAASFSASEYLLTKNS